MVWKRIQSVLVVSVISLGVWLFAESESLGTKELQLTVVVASGEGDMAIEIPDGQQWRDRVTVTVRGSSAGLSALENEARDTVVLRPNAEGMPTDIPFAVVDLKQVISNLPAIAKRGIAISRVEPPTVRIWQDRLESRTLPVVVDAGNAELEGPPEPATPTAVVRFPKSLGAKLKPDARVVARVAKESLEGLAAGQKESVNATLLVPQELESNRHAVVKPQEIKVQLTLRSRTATTTLKQVYIQLSLSPKDVGQWEVKLDGGREYVENVVARGPAELIESLKSGQLRAVAMLPLTYDDLAKGGATTRVVFTTMPPSPAPLEFTSVENAVVKWTAKRPIDPAAGGNGVKDGGEKPAGPDVP